MPAIVIYKHISETEYVILQLLHHPESYVIKYIIENQDK